MWVSQDFLMCEYYSGNVYICLQDVYKYVCIERMEEM